MKISLKLRLLTFRLAIIALPLLAFTVPQNAPIKKSTETTDCVYTYILEAKDGRFTVSLLSNQTINPPYHTTATAQVTLKVPTGNFKITNLENLIEGVEFSQNGRSNAPNEDSAYDYIVFGLASFGTRNIRYQKDGKIPLFSFENGGDCTGQPIALMENFTDPFYPPNSERANVSQQITVAKTGADLSIVCINSNSVSDCGKKLSKKDLKRLQKEKNSEK